MKTIKVKFESTTALMLNNPRTVNPMDYYSKALKEYTSKRTKTDDDMQEIYRLKFLASCYLNNKGQYIIPSNMIIRSICEAAKELKLGKKFERSCMVYEDALLNFANNGNTPEELYENFGETYVDIRAVGIMKSKVITARMIVPEWSLETEISFDENVLNDSEVFNVLNIAGLRYGIGTYRQRYGKFSVTEVKDNKKK